jgi:hypothetical protein
MEIGRPIKKKKRKSIRQINRLPVDSMHFTSGHFCKSLVTHLYPNKRINSRPNKSTKNHIFSQFNQSVSQSFSVVSSFCCPLSIFLNMFSQDHARKAVEDRNFDEWLAMKELFGEVGGHPRFVAEFNEALEQFLKVADTRVVLEDYVNSALPAAEDHGVVEAEEAEVVPGQDQVSFFSNSIDCSNIFLSIFLILCF